MTRTTVCVHGLGYVGLPTAAILANSGHEVFGFDVDPDHRQNLETREFTFEEPDLERFVGRALDDGLTVVGDPEPAEFHVICVPTPYDEDLDQTDLSYVEAAGEQISGLLRSGDTVILSSTVPPGTTVGKLQKTIEREGLSTSEDVVLAYSPETVLPGNTLTELRENDRLVGTVDARSTDRIVALYDSFVTGDVRVTDATTAEFVKLIQNAYRDVNIAFANEVAKLADEFGIDARSSIGLANNHPRVDILRPGPGVGGHCIPIDPLFLSQGNDVSVLIEAARTVNDGMVEFVEELLVAALGGVHDSTITVLGLAYKGGVADTRKSPAFGLIDRLVETGIEQVRITDPYVDESELDLDLTSLEDSLQGSDAAVIVTDHPEYRAFDPETFAERMDGRVIVDTRGLLDEDRWNGAGFDVYQI